MTEFLGERTIRKTRKSHVCESCQSAIAPGSTAIYSTSVQDGQFFAWYNHAECRAAETAWNQWADHYADEYQWLWEIFEDGGEDVPWLAAEFPLVAGRMGIMLEGMERPAAQYRWAA